MSFVSLFSFIFASLDAQVHLLFVVSKSALAGALEAFEEQVKAGRLQISKDEIVHVGVTSDTIPVFALCRFVSHQSLPSASLAILVATKIQQTKLKIAVVVW